MSIVKEPLYLKKSIKIFRFYTITLVVLILTNILLRPLRDDYLILIEALVLLPVLIVFVLAPIGLYYNWRSYKAKEEPIKKRTIFFMGHVFFCTIVVLIILGVAKDLSSINF